MRRSAGQQLLQAGEIALMRDGFDQRLLGIFKGGSGQPGAGLWGLRHGSILRIARSCPSPHIRHIQHIRHIRQKTTQTVHRPWRHPVQITHLLEAPRDLAGHISQWAKSRQPGALAGLQKRRRPAGRRHHDQRRAGNHATVTIQNFPHRGLHL